MLRFICLSAVTLLLAACSSTGSGVPTLEFRDEGASRAIYGPHGTTLADLRGKTFRVLTYGAGNAGSVPAYVEAQVGSVTFLDDGSGWIVVEMPFTSTATYAPNGDPGEYVSVNPVTGAFRNETTATLFEYGDNFLFYTFTDRDGFGSENTSIVGGLETPVASRPANGTYSGIGVFQMTNEDRSMLTVSGTSRLVADFSSGEISGELINVDDPTIDVNGNGQFNDRFLMTATLENGEITPEGFTGQVDITGSTVLGGVGDEVALGMNVTSSGVEGAFYGPEANAVGAVYEGDLLYTGPDGSTGDLSFVGITAGDR